MITREQIEKCITDNCEDGGSYLRMTHNCPGNIIDEIMALIEAEDHARDMAQLDVCANCCEKSPDDPWTYVEDGLPERDVSLFDVSERLLMLYQNKFIEIGCYSFKEKSWMDDQGRPTGGVVTEKVIAWKPLPKQPMGRNES